MWSYTFCVTHSLENILLQLVCQQGGVSIKAHPRLAIATPGEKLLQTFSDFRSPNSLSYVFNQDSPGQ